MTKIVYKIVEHAGGWAYQAEGTFSETFETRQDALEAARQAVREQSRPDEDVEISFEDTRGRWHNEHSSGTDRPDAVAEE